MLQRQLIVKRVTFPITVTKELSGTQLVGTCLKSLFQQKKKKVGSFDSFSDSSSLRQPTPSKRRQAPAENACTPAVRIQTSSSQEATCSVGAFLNASGISAWLNRLDSALTQAGSGSQRRSGLDFQHRQNESGVSVPLYGDVPLLQQLNTDRVLLSGF